VAGGTHLGILAPHAIRVESGTVGIEPPPPERRMAREAVALRVARDARLEALARRLAVTQQEETLRVMKSRAQHAVRDQPGLTVSGGAEAADVVAVATRRLTRVRGRGVPVQEARGVVSRSRRRHRAMAIHALGADVAAGAA